MPVLIKYLINQAYKWLKWAKKENKMTDKLYKIRIKTKERLGELVVIAESEIGALYEGLHLLDTAGIQAELLGIDFFCC